MKKAYLVTLLLCTFLMNCSTSDEDDSNVTPQDETPTVDDDTSNDDSSDDDSSVDLSVYKKIYGASDIYVEGDFVVIEVDGLPDHGSPYYQDTEWSSRYEAYNSNDFHLNPNRISSFDRVVKLPLNPQEATNHQPTSLGTMGIAVNGVSFYNQYAGPNNQPLTDEIFSFDQYNGHPQRSGEYHYHLEPVYLTSQDTIGSEGLLGFLLDGFPVYGPRENGVAVTNDDLDDYHGHSHATEDYPDGTYHYHITAEDPYINGNGYYGTPGTSTN
ncbi:YHYH protein [Flammeovirga sp. OC4]|uniref:YHYH protein n=1 Tax=Flammeovirga sp. OC4 TaxID=1382345 RepID=UPI0005C66D78|nr:YHYH protein [Flammeovirga sp. OC4]